MLNGLRAAQLLKGKQRCLNRQHTHILHMLPVKINRPLALQRVISENASGNMLEICAQHAVKQSGRAAGNISVIGFNQLGYPVAALFVVMRYVCFALLNPEIGPEYFQRPPV